MKTKLLLMFLFLTITLQAQTNLVPNGNFENWTSSSQPDNWFKFSNGLVSQNAMAQNGSSSAKMQIKAGIFNFMNSELFPVVAGKTYRVSMYHKLVSGSFSDIRLTLYHKPGTFKEEITNKSDDIFSSTEWRKIEFDFTPTVSENIEIEIFNSGNGDSEILVDNVSVIDVATLGPQYTLIPDINFETKLISLGIDSGTTDGKVLTSKVASLTSLNVSNSSITNLTGIEDFIALNSLNCQNNRLNQLNISKNIKLTNLVCSNNLLTTLNLDNNPRLNVLKCADNKLALLDFSNNTILNSIECENNQLISIDVSKQLMLESLDCRNNTLKILDVSSNLKLSSLWCNNNLLKSLDLSKNNKLSVMTAHTNLLTYLNIQNGTNYLFNPNSSYATFYGNNLECIQVDNVEDANKIWSQVKDPSTSFSTDCKAYTLIPDVNFEKKLIALGIDKDGVNGKVLTSNVASVKSLYIDGNSITDLTGIQDFIALTTLECTNNQITNLDLSGNLALKNLNCIANQITKIDVSKNLALNSLWISSNKLTNLDVSANLNLTSLWISSNKLTNLDVSANLNLTSLVCDRNLLTSLDLTKNNALKSLNCIYNKLTCILVADVDYATKNWSITKDNTASLTTDCNAVTLIPDFNFETKLISLGIDSGAPDGKVLTTNIASLTSLNVANSSIIDLTGIEDFKELTVLYASKNQITTLNLSANINLTSLTVSENKLKSINVRANVLLTSLSIGKNELTTLDVSQNTKLNHINADYNQLTALDLSNNLQLTQVVVSDNQLTALDLSKSNAITFLQCSSNKLTSLDISNASLLTSLNCHNNQLTALDMLDSILLKSMTCQNNSLLSLDVTKNTNLEYLNSSSNKLTSLDLTKNLKIETLYCYSNQLTTLDVSNNKLLINLYVYDNSLTTIDVSNNTLLTRLYVYKNYLTDIDVSKNAELTYFFCFNNQLTSLDITNNKKIKGLRVNLNNLTSLNLKNGNNTIFDTNYTNFNDNPNLTCILVDNKWYSDTNWASSKDATATYNDYSCTQFTSIPDVNFEKKLIELGYDSGTPDGKVLTANIYKITNLDVSASDISDLSGIEDFGALVQLECNSNKIKSIDISKNKLLTKLGIYENQLTALDVKNNINLVNLQCSINQISNLDLSKNTQLLFLSASLNNLTTIDLSNNSLIRLLYIDRNKLINLDTKNLIDLEWLECGNNNIISLDLSNNTKLKELYCYFTKITALDVSKNVLLKTINAANNSLTSLDLSKNKDLTLVYVVFNPLTSLNLQNGNNSNFITQTTNKTNSGLYCSFLNANLNCIQVDNAQFSNTNWSKIKDATTSYSESCANLSTSDLIFEKLNVYPNPTKGALFIENVSVNNLRIYDGLGKQVNVPFSSNGTSTTANLEQFPKGIYYMYIESEGETTVRKVIVE
nr:T9SS type A sorting domain-containing protein [uncultured Flavobacterium sp.]